MNYLLDDTIAAIASAPGGAARGVVRLSGPQTASCLQAIFRADDALDILTRESPTRITGRLLLASPGRVLPCDLLYWPDQRSYTREPLAELHLLGSPPLVEASLRTVCVAGARVARPGEFTLRAFLAGRLDLTQAEAVLGVIDADDGAQLRVAIAQLAGGLAMPLGSLRDDLLDLLAELEAGLDFVEEDIEFVSRAELLSRLHRASDAIGELESQMQTRSTAGALPTVVLYGPPNVGKSSLFNALTQDSTAIVADVAGTTRDYLTATLELDTARCRLIDTAGLDPTEPVDELERAAQQTTRTQRATADLEIYCVDAREAPDLASFDSTLAVPSPAVRRLYVLTKADLALVPFPKQDPRQHILATSSSTGLGLAELRRAMADELNELAANSGNVVNATATRCRESLRRARESLAHAVDIVGQQGGEELIAAELRTALEELGQVVGTVYTDDILDRIFTRFCIGK
ncbi:MAG: tRNA modification GTPase [Pirellulales bacterium]|nr:tRNA modification GTPase [Pirellulales bacterium]